MTNPLGLQYLWWLVSDASGVVAIVLISLSVLLGLAMAGGAVKQPSLRRTSARLHEHLALMALAAIAVHGLALLGDQWLKPGWRGITVPFELSYRPGFTGIGIIAGYLAALLGPSFYLRRRIGVRRWRKLHRVIVVVWILSLAHALGAGTDGSKLWMRTITDTSYNASMSTAGWSACACCSQNPWSHPRRLAGAGHTDSQPQYSSRSPRIAQARVSVCAASTVVALSGAVRLGGLRSRACRCSHGHRPSGCDTEARDRRATLPQPHRSGVGGSLTQTPLRRAYRLQTPCSAPIVRGYFGSA